MFLIQGVELETVSVPVHKIILKCDIISGPVTVGVQHSFPVKGVNLILGNDIVGGKVTALPYMINNPVEVQDHTQEVIVYPACAVTRAMATQTKVATTKNDREKTQQKVQKEPNQDKSNQPQPIGKEKLVKFQEADPDLVHIWESF